MSLSDPCFSCSWWRRHPALHSFLHDALPILVLISGGASANWIAPAPSVSLEDKQSVTRALLACGRSEEHTSELQSHSDLVCRLLLEKKYADAARRHALRVAA